MTPAPRVPIGRAATRADPAADPRVVTAYIRRISPAPVKRPPSSRTLARMREKAEEQARNAEAARALRAQVQPAPGQLFGADVAGMVLRGPAGGWPSEEALIEALKAPGRKLSAAGLQMAKARRAAKPTDPITGPRSR